MRHHAFAAAMGLATAAFFAPCSQSQAASADPTGYWMKPDAERESKIQVFKCGNGKKLLCAKIAWLKNPLDSKGRTLHDIRNENPSLRDRPIVGLTIFTGLAPSAPSTWTGKIYNPEDGHTYSATLTVLSRKEIKLRGCKAWLLCGEKQWLRTSAPPADVIESKPAEGTQQIEASVTPPATPAAEPKPEAVAAAEPEPAPSVEAAVPDLPDRASLPPQETQAAAVAAAPAAPERAQAAMSPALVTEEIAASAPPPEEFNWRKGYGFIHVSTAPDTSGRLTGENVSSMFTMAKPLAAESVPPAAAEQSEATAAIEPVPAPAPKPKVKAKPVVANAAAANPAPKAAPPAKPQGAPAPQEASAAQAEADAAQAETADAAMAEEPVPLSRRQKRLLRRQQQEPFLPWLR